MSDSSGSVGRFVGLVLVLVSVLWMAFSGLCAATMIYSLIVETGFTEEVAVWGFGVLFISGISAALGYAVFVVGRGLRR